MGAVTTVEIRMKENGTRNGEDELRRTVATHGTMMKEDDSRNDEGDREESGVGVGEDDWGAVTNDNVGVK
jgi:hypothetical protein